MHVVFFVLCLALSLYIYASKFDLFRLGTYMDDASYAVLAQSFVFSNSYGLINTPWEAMSTQFPFGFPLLLSPLAGWRPNNPEILKFVSLGATLMNSLLLFLGWPWLCPGKSYWRALSITALYAFSPQVCMYTRMVMSEPVFLMYALTALILAERLAAAAKHSWPWCLGLGFIGIYIYCLRSIGIIAFGVIAARVCGSISRRSVKNFYCLVFGAVLAVVLITVLTPVSLRDFVPRDYWQQFTHPEAFGTSAESRYLARVVPHAAAYAGDYLWRLIPFPGEANMVRLLGIPNLVAFCGLLMGGLLLAGLIILSRHRDLKFGIALFTVLYCCVLLGWPWTGERFLYPIYPFLCLFLLQGIHGAALLLCRIVRAPDSLSRRLAAGFTALSTVWILAVFIDRDVNDAGSLHCTPDFTIGPSWLKQHTAPSSIILAQQPQIVFLYSQRKTIENGWFSETPDLLMEALRENQINYLLIAPQLKWYSDGKFEVEPFVRDSLLPMVESLSKAGKLRLVFNQERDQIRIYQVAEI